jgi:hypothetical protein
VVEEEILVPTLKDSDFDEAKIVSSEIRKDLINILLADLLQDEDEGSLEPRLEALAREFDTLIEAHQAEGESIRAAIEGADGESPSLGSRLKTRYDRLKQRFANIDDNLEDALGMLAPRRLSAASARKRGAERSRYGNTRERYREGRFEDETPYRGGPDRDEQGRFMSEGGPRSGRFQGDDEHYGPRSLGSMGRDRGEGRFQGDDEHYGPRSLGSMGRDRDEGRFSPRGGYDEGRGQRGWYGNPQGRSEGMRSGAQNRPREYDEDERYRRSGGEGGGRSGWYGDPVGHSRAARRGWDESREGEGPYGSRSRYEDDNRQGYQGRRSSSENDDQRRPSRGASRGDRY